MKPITLRWKKLFKLDYIDALYTNYRSIRIIYLPKDKKYLVHNFNYTSDHIRDIINHIDKLYGGNNG